MTTQTEDTNMADETTVVDTNELRGLTNAISSHIAKATLIAIADELDRLRTELASARVDAARFDRIMEIRAAERDQSAKQIEHMARLLGSIHMVLYPQIQKIEGGQSMRFMPPNPHDYIQMLSDKIRAIPAELAAIDAALSQVQP